MLIYHREGTRDSLSMPLGNSLFSAMNGLSGVNL